MTSSKSETPSPKPDRIPVALTIAGSDSGGGAGIQADIKSMQANGVFATSAITAITAQNTRAVTKAMDLPVEMIEAQIDAVYDDFEVAAVKTGMLSSAAIIEAVVKKIEQWEMQPLVVDPVMISTSGYVLLQEDAIATLVHQLIPKATIVTPNTHEAAHLTGQKIESLEAAEEAAKAIYAMGAKAVLVKGGHLEGRGQAPTYFTTARASTISTPSSSTRRIPTAPVVRMPPPSPLILPAATPLRTPLRTPKSTSPKPSVSASPSAKATARRTIFTF